MRSIVSLALIPLLLLSQGVALIAHAHAGTHGAVSAGDSVQPHFHLSVHDHHSRHDHHSVAHHHGKDALSDHDDHEDESSDEIPYPVMVDVDSHHSATIYVSSVVANYPSRQHADGAWSVWQQCLAHQLTPSWDNLATSAQSGCYCADISQGECAPTFVALDTLSLRI